METIKRRLVWTLAILVFFFSLAAARTGYIQVIRGEHYSRMALAWGTSGVSLEDYSRGRILDRHSRPLTGSYISNRILVFPELLEDPDFTATALSGATGAGLPAVSSMLSGGKPAILPIGVKGGQAGLIRESGLKGVLVAPFSFRYGPRPLASHVVGHLGKIRDTRELEELNRTTGKKYRISDWIGRQGLEYFYEKELRGMYPAAYAGLYTDALGKPLSGLPVFVNTKMNDSTRCDVVTTIDANIQDMVERVMDRHIKKGAVVVMDRSTGDLLAVASRPGYNPDPAVNDLL
ncbi:MAG: penicillin-binding protein 2, partial [Firmicutes bacterium]|nr:penicillin-binding protein 2 [Bacillota bacterium]